MEASTAEYRFFPKEVSINSKGARLIDMNSGREIAWHDTWTQKLRDALQNGEMLKAVLVNELLSETPHPDFDFFRDVDDAALTKAFLIHLGTLDQADETNLANS